MDSPSFPAGFLWGAATAAYQIEGAPLADGAGPSIWHHFAHTPGRTHGGHTGDVACDHYRRYAEDVALMQALGLNAYRFSIAWARVLPEGVGRLNGAGIAFYDRLVDALLEAGVEPLVTLYHWDLPAALDHRGGWLNPDVADWFADYTRAVVGRIGDRVRRWVTINEPWVVMDGGYVNGVLAPGHRNRFQGPVVAHNLLRTHAAAVQAFRAEAEGEIGLVVNLEPKYPASERPEDHAAAARADAYMNRLFLDPVLLGRYPDGLRELFGPAWPDFPAGDLAFIQQPIDFLGVNYYTRAVVRDSAEGYPDRTERVVQERQPYTEMGWEVYAPALTDLLLRLREAYPLPPVFITENGAAFYDPPQAANGLVDDPLRVGYLRDHLLALARALGGGWTCAATSRGRSSTTSSGATATRSGSASSTWTSRPRSGRRRRAPSFTPTLSARGGPFSGAPSDPSACPNERGDGASPRVTAAVSTAA